MPQTETKPSTYRRINGRLKSLNLAQATRWSVYFIAIGLIAGLGSIVFHYLCQLGLHYFLDMLAGYRPPSPAGEHHLLPPTSVPLQPLDAAVPAGHGGVISGWLVYTFAPEAEGHGTDAAINAYHNKGGFIRGRVPIIKTIASAITLTTGGSGGGKDPLPRSVPVSVLFWPRPSSFPTASAGS
jgi:CIC family chloride channel protein